MIELLTIWVGLLGVLILAIGPPGRGGALTLAYFLGLSLIHVPGVLPFLTPDRLVGGVETTFLGFEMTVSGIAAFIGGVLAGRVASWRRVGIASPQGTVPGPPEQLGWRTLAIGAFAYFALSPWLGRIPSATAILSGFGTFLVLGFWLVLYGAAAVGDRWLALRALLLLPLLPLSTLVTGGFLGYGVYWVLATVAFLYVVWRRRRWMYVAAPLVVFLGLSLFVTYMGQRDAIRELFWYKQSNLGDRLDRVSRLVTDFEILDLSSPKHVAAIDGRLNQNSLVGAAIAAREAGMYDFAYGGTVPYWLLIPRAIWPDKPAVGGGGTLVAQYTGIEFASGTSVGAGQVLEFYVNFGLAGVLAGFAALGFLLVRLDYGIMRSLAVGDVRGLLLRAMPGLALLQPGGNLLEIFVAVAGAIAGAYLVLRLGLFNPKPAAGDSARPSAATRPLAIEPGTPGL